MKYNAMPGSVIIKIEAKQQVSQTQSGLVLVESESRSSTEVAEVISVGDERDDIKVGTKILFPTSTGLKIDKTTYYLKYEDICAIISE